MHTAEPAGRRLRRMVSTVVSKLKLFSCFLPRPVPIPISAMYFPGKTRRMHIQCQVSIWAGYSVVKVPCRAWNRAPSPSYPGAFQGYSQASKARQKKFFWKILWLLLHRQIKSRLQGIKFHLQAAKLLAGSGFLYPVFFTEIAGQAVLDRALTGEGTGNGKPVIQVSVGIPNLAEIGFNPLLIGQTLIDLDSADVHQFFGVRIFHFVRHHPHPAFWFGSYRYHVEFQLH